CLYHFLFLFFSLIPPPPSSTLFPYTTLFRSVLVEGPTARQFAALGNAWTVRAGRWLAATGLLVSEGRDFAIQVDQMAQLERIDPDRKSTRLNSSHLGISYAVFCLKKKKKK